MARTVTTPVPANGTGRSTRRSHGATDVLDEMGLDAELPDPIDGREARAHRTRKAIIDAWIDLVESGEQEPTARMIAAQANIGLRTVFQHFEDLDALHAAGAVRHLQRMSSLDVPIDADGTVEDRIAALVAKRSRWFEKAMPLRLAATRREAGHPQMSMLLAAGDERLAAETAQVFSAELDQWPKKERAEVAATLDAAASFGMWLHLRQRRNLSAALARKIVTRQLEAMLLG
jgi:TetR/AcrR family transcriptional regulator, regulator of autoinduction and epiphytic fitness